MPGGGSKRLTDAQLDSMGPVSSTTRWRRKREAKSAHRPAVWDRAVPGDEAIIDPGVAARLLRERTGYDCRAGADAYEFRPERAKAAVRWFHEHLTHVKGSEAGRALVLAPLYQAWLMMVFGWYHCKSGLRRYRSVFLYWPRKAAKTLMAAGLALYVFLEDGEGGAEVYCAAAARDQARLLWTTARKMVQQDEYLSERCLLYQHAILRQGDGGEPDGSWFQAISAEATTAHGFNAHCFIVDELHAQPDGELVDVLETSVASRTQPLAVYITTADFDRVSICNEKLEYAKKVASGVIADHAFLPVVFESQADEPWESEETWARVNPLYPMTPTRDYMVAQCEKAKLNPRFLNTFLRLHLNRKTSTDLAWLDMGKWAQCGQPFDVKELTGLPCYGALDLSAVSDLTCFVLVFPTAGNAVLCWFWAPRDTAKRRDERHILPSYLAWERTGHMELCDGGWIDQRKIREHIVALGKVYHIQDIAVDRWHASKIVTELGEEDGFKITMFGQGFASMSGPSKELERLVLARELRHGGHPVLSWCAANAMAATDNSPADNIKPVKARTKQKARNQDDNKIDGIVALVMALGVSMLEASPHVDMNALYAAEYKP